MSKMEIEYEIGDKFDKTFISLEKVYDGKQEYVDVNINPEFLYRPSFYRDYVQTFDIEVRGISPKEEIYESFDIEDGIPHEVYAMFIRDLLNALDTEEGKESFIDNLTRGVKDIADMEKNYGAIEVDSYAFADDLNIDRDIVWDIYDFATSLLTHEDYKEIPDEEELEEEYVSNLVDGDDIIKTIKMCAIKDNFNDFVDCVLDDEHIMQSITEAVVLGAEDSEMSAMEYEICTAVRKYPEEFKDKFGSEVLKNLEEACGFS